MQVLEVGQLESATRVNSSRFSRRQYYVAEAMAEVGSNLFFVFTYSFT